MMNNGLDITQLDHIYAGIDIAAVLFIIFFFLGIIRILFQGPE
jgi:hypothetical protein